MREDFLHFIWKYKKIRKAPLVSSQNETIEILSEGTHNHLSGPDFFNAKIKINEQLWAGNVEIHNKSSDWYAHGHESDQNYDNVILHVVWDDDVAIFRKGNSQISTLELKGYVSKEVFEAYQKLFESRTNKFINCQNEISSVNDFIFKNWLERLLLRNFGLKINGESFQSLSESLPFNIVRKIGDNALQLEAAFFGMVGFLESDEILDAYYLHLRKEYQYLAHKFKLNNQTVQKPEFFKLRPSNFPTLRLAQIANLYSKNQNLFRKIIDAQSLDAIYEVFDVQASEYWNSHFTFGRESKKSPKKLTKNFIELLLINTILPLKFQYTKHFNTEEEPSILEIIASIKNERNSIIDNFLSLGLGIANAMESQAVLQLYNNYCSKNNCLHCAVGHHLLKGNT